MTNETKPPSRKTKDGPSPVDSHVGLRIRARRIVLGLSQSELGGKVGLTFQQIQKYERGANRIGAGRLFEFGHILDVPIGYFYEEMAPELKVYTQRGKTTDKQAQAVSLESDIMCQRETLNLVRTYYKIDDDMVRQRFVDLMREAARLCPAPSTKD